MARVRGNFKSLLKRLPEAVADELRTELRSTGERVLSRAKSRAPVYAGRPRKGRVPGTLRSSLSAKVLEKSLKLKVGIVGKAAAKAAFYARFQEFGWRPFRKNRARKLMPLTDRGYVPGTTAYKLAALSRKRQRVAPRHFLYTTSRAELYQPFQKLWGRAIHQAASGATSE